MSDAESPWYECPSEIADFLRGDFDGVMRALHEDGSIVGVIADALDRLVGDNQGVAAGHELAAAVDRFYRDLRYTAPEAVSQRLNELGARVAKPMAVFGYPRTEEAPDA